MGKYFSKHSIYKYSHWLKPVMQVFAGQMSFQIMGLAITLLLVRNLDKNDYGLYTVLMSIQAMMATLSESGIMIGFQKIGGKIWKDNKELSSLIKTGATIRARIFVLALVVTFSYGIFIFLKQSVSFWNIIIFLLFITINVVPEIQVAFLKYVLLLKKDVKKVQWMLIINQGIRLVLIAGAIFLLHKYFNLYVALVISAIGALTAFFYISLKTKEIRELHPVVNTEYRKDLIHYIKINWHNAAFYTFNGQISVFLIGVFGSTANLANLGAITRFSLIFTMILALASNLFHPAFGREQNKAGMWSKYKYALLAWLGIAIISLILVYFFSPYLLLVLGEGYQHLNYELFLVFVLGLIVLAVGLIHGMNTTKGWIKYNVFWEIPVNLAALFLGVFIFDLTELTGVLYLSILTSTAGLILTMLNSYAGFKEYSE